MFKIGFLRNSSQKNVGAWQLIFKGLAVKKNTPRHPAGRTVIDMTSIDRSK